MQVDKHSFHWQQHQTQVPVQTVTSSIHDKGLSAEAMSSTRHHMTTASTTVAAPLCRPLQCNQLGQKAAKATTLQGHAAAHAVVAVDFHACTTPSSTINAVTHNVLLALFSAPETAHQQGSNTVGQNRQQCCDVTSSSALQTITATASDALYTKHQAITAVTVIQKQALNRCLCYPDMLAANTNTYD